MTLRKERFWNSKRENEITMLEKIRFGRIYGPSNGYLCDGSSYGKLRIEKRPP
jgi:hypothetical protein